MKGTAQTAVTSGRTSPGRGDRRASTSAEAPQSSAQSSARRSRPSGARAARARSETELSRAPLSAPLSTWFSTIVEVDRFVSPNFSLSFLDAPYTTFFIRHAILHLPRGSTCTESAPHSSAAQCDSGAPVDIMCHCHDDVGNILHVAPESRCYNFMLHHL